jgi:outer membrane lipoprotein SlyB
VEPSGVGLGGPTGQGPGRGKGSVLAGVEGEAGRGWAESRARLEFKKIFF